MDFKETEEKIKKYYESLKVIRQLKHRLEVYNQRKAEIENKIDNSIIKLPDSFTAVNYDGVGGSSNLKTSPQERAVDKAFNVLERNLKEVNAEILLIEEQISNIQAENSDIEYIVKDMKPEYVNILKSLYEYKNGTLETSLKYNMDRVTVYRKKDKIINEVMKWLNFYNAK